VVYVCLLFAAEFAVSGRARFAEAARWWLTNPQAALEAYPQVVPPGWWTHGTTRIVSRTSDGSPVRIYVSRDGEPEVLFAAAAGRLSESPAPWIATGSRYEFRLYNTGTPPVRLASVTVTREDDTSLALRAVLAMLVLVPMVTRFSVGWLLDIGVPSLVVAGLWIKTVYVTSILRPSWGFVPAERTVLSAGLASLILLFVPLLWVPRRWRLAAGLVFDLVVTFCIHADVVHARFFEDVISIPDIMSAPNLRAVVPSVIALLRSTDVLYYADIIVGLALLPAYLRACRHTSEPLWPARRQLARLALAALLLLLPTAQLVHDDPGDILESPWSRRAIVAELGISPFHLYDAATTAYRHVRRLGIGESERRDVERLIGTLRDEGQRPSELFGVARGRNLILLQIESLSAFPVDMEIGGQVVMPNLAQFKREGLAFVNFFDQTSVGSTADGTFTSLQSLHPAAAGVVNMRYVDNQFRALPAVLAAHGYATVAAWGATRETWNVGQMFERFGFQQSYFIDSYRVGERIQGWIPDRDFLAQTLDRLPTGHQPFMAFPVTSSSHFPFKIPEHYRELALGALEGTTLGDYLHATHYFDRAFGEFIAGLRAQGLLEQSVVAVYGDHHAYFDDLNPVAKALGWPENSEYHDWQLKRRVPFIIRLPHGQAAGPRTVSGGHLDIAPTLLSLLGIRDEQSVMLGHDLTRGVDSLVVFRDGSFVDGSQLWINDMHTGKAVCYEQPSGRPIDCAGLTHLRDDAREHLRVSDAIIEGNLISALAPDSSHASKRPAVAPH
jgi:lipoteichoic acid synthase